MTATNSTPEKTNVFVEFFDMIAAPRQAMSRINLYPRSWWFPALLAVLTALLVLWTSLDYLLDVAQRAAQLQLSTQDLSPEQLEAAQSMMERLMQPNFMLIQGAIGILLGVVLAWGLNTLIIYLSASIGGANPKASSMWALVVWTWVPFIVRNVVYGVFGLFSDVFSRSPGLTWFVSTGDIIADQSNPLYVAAAQVDIFSLWHLILIYILLRTPVSMGRASAIIVTLLYALINLGLRVGISQLSGLVGG